MAVIISSNRRSISSNRRSIFSNCRLTSRNPARISSRSASNLESILEPSLEHTRQPSVIMATTIPAEATSDGIHCTPSGYHKVSGAARVAFPGRQVPTSAGLASLARRWGTGNLGLRISGGRTAAITAATKYSLHQLKGSDDANNTITSP